MEKRNPVLFKFFEGHRIVHRLFHEDGLEIMFFPLVRGGRRAPGAGKGNDFAGTRLIDLFFAHGALL